MMITVEKVVGAGGSGTIAGAASGDGSLARRVDKHELNKAYKMMLHQRRDAVSGQSGDEAMLRSTSPATKGGTNSSMGLTLASEDEQKQRKEHVNGNEKLQRNADEKCMPKCRGPKKEGAVPAKKWSSALRVVAAMTRFKNIPKVGQIGLNKAGNGTEQWVAKENRDTSVHSTHSSHQSLVQRQTEAKTYYGKQLQNQVQRTASASQEEVKRVGANICAISARPAAGIRVNVRRVRRVKLLWHTSPKVRALRRGMSTANETAARPRHSLISGAITARADRFANNWHRKKKVNQQQRQAPDEVQQWLSSFFSESAQDGRNGAAAIAGGGGGGGTWKSSRLPKCCDYDGSDFVDAKPSRLVADVDSRDSGTYSGNEYCGVGRPFAPTIRHVCDRRWVNATASR
ncbi:hypothetical protein niasHT_008890 [Heterodera trifolii]|uniref:Uncharacterized protein n=1 Tax=Heterodera trifolii TaxID=157864 RepID=A0ABD2LYC0_9BILA